MEVVQILAVGLPLRRLILPLPCRLTKKDGIQGFGLTLKPINPKPYSKLQKEGTWLKDDQSWDPPLVGKLRYRDKDVQTFRSLL